MQVHEGRRGAVWLGLAALVLLALNLRSPLTSVAPVIAAIRGDLGVGTAAAGLLTTIPVLCFGVLTPLASAFIARTSIDTAVLVTLGGVAAGTLLRPLGGFAAMMGGTVVIGAALTVGNIVALMVIARDYPQRMRSVTGLYTSCLNFGTMLTSGLTAPLALLMGWRSATATWAALAVLAGGVWLLARRAWTRAAEEAPAAEAPGAQGTKTAPAVPVPAVPVWRRPLVWLLAVAFTAHLVVYYSLTAWLPLLLTDTAGMGTTEAGFVASLFQVLALIGSFGVPLMLRRFSGAVAIASVGGFWIVTTLGFLGAPGAWLLWSITGGIASGAGFTSIFVLAMAHTRDLDDNRRVSSVVQGVGYLFSSMGPMLTGALHQASGGWSASLLMLTLLAVPTSVAGLAVSRLLAPRA